MPLLRKELLLLLLLLPLISTFCQTTPSNFIVRSRDVIFEFEQQVAEITVYPGSINPNSWYKLVFTHLEEYDAKFQQKYADVKFGSNFTYTHVVNDNDVQNLNMSAFLSSGARVNVNNYIYSRSTTVDYGNQSIIFHPSSLRLNIQVILFLHSFFGNFIEFY
jgi:hypothetical protein